MGFNLVFKCFKLELLFDFGDAGLKVKVVGVGLEFSQELTELRGSLGGADGVRVPQLFHHGLNQVLEVVGQEEGHLVDPVKLRVTASLNAPRSSVQVRLEDHLDFTGALNAL